MSLLVSVRQRSWWLCGLLFAAIALSFLDRQNLSVLAPQITEQLDLTNVEFFHVTTAFLVGRDGPH